MFISGRLLNLPMLGVSQGVKSSVKKTTTFSSPTIGVLPTPPLQNSTYSAMTAHASGDESDDKKKNHAPDATGGSTGDNIKTSEEVSREKENKDSSGDGDNIKNTAV